jgi:hypothetical protein
MATVLSVFEEFVKVMREYRSPQTALQLQRRAEEILNEHRLGSLSQEELGHISLTGKRLSLPLRKRPSRLRDIAQTFLRSVPPFLATAFSNQDTGPVTREASQVSDIFSDKETLLIADAD